jgi:hypothetical protein
MKGKTMKYAISALAIYVCFAAAGCPSTPAQPPATPHAVPISPETMAGSWINESIGLTLTIDPDGRFTWKQGKILEEGSYSISGETLVLAVSSGQSTPYQILSLTSDQLTLQDPRGSVAYLVRGSQIQAEEPGKEPQPELPSLPTPAIDLQKLYGKWTGPYGLDIELKQDGSFKWTQPDYRIDGTFSVEGSVLTLNVQGNPTKYSILSLTDDKLLITDPDNHEIALVRKKIVITPYTPVTPVTPVQEKAQGPIFDEKSLFSMPVPEGWKASRSPECAFPCKEPYVLEDPAGRKITLVTDTFISRAGPGAFDRLVPDLDKLMGAYTKNREKIVDELESMNGMEAFSRRFTGKTPDEKEVMVSRIIGVHYSDYLILGAVVTATSSKTYKSLKTVMKEITDKMNFSFEPGAELQTGIVGTWIGSSAEAASLLSLKSKHLFLFYADGKFVHAVVSDKFVANETGLKAQLSNPSNDSGTYRIIGSALVLDFAATAQGAPQRTEGHGIRIKGNNLSIDSMFLEKVLF